MRLFVILFSFVIFFFSTALALNTLEHLEHYSKHFLAFSVVSFLIFLFNLIIELLNINFKRT